MISTQTNNVAGDLLFERENRIDAALRVWTSVDVVAEKHHRIVLCHFNAKTCQQIRQRAEVPMNVSNGNRRHVRTHNTAHMTPGHTESTRSPLTAADIVDAVRRLAPEIDRAATKSRRCVGCPRIWS